MHRADTCRGGCVVNGSLHEELERLIGATCNGTISVEDSARLDSLLQTRHEACRFYNNYMFLHAEMYAQHASSEPAEILLASQSLPRESGKPAWLKWLAVAAAFVGVAAGSSWITYGLSRNTL